MCRQELHHLVFYFQTEIYTPQTSTNISPSELMFNITSPTCLSNLKMNSYKQDIDIEDNKFSSYSSSKGESLD